MSACVFCAIVAGQSPATITGQTRDSLMIVPLCPVNASHRLIIPRKHVRDAASDPDVTARAMRDAAEYARDRYPQFNIITSAGEAATQTVRHLHLHLIERTSDDLLMVPWGTLHGESPSAPHRCRGMRELERALGT